MEEIQNLVLSQLNKAIAEKLTTTILNLREAYLGTLQRCLGSLEKTCEQDVEHSMTKSSPECQAETQRASEASIRDQRTDLSFPNSYLDQRKDPSLGVDPV